ncbi:MAG TPA: hypothetical protein VGK48_15975 [Terriglobia bacterium]|jgi:hypothetical protein
MKVLGKIALAAAALGGVAAVWFTIDFRRPVSADIRDFDPAEVARLDTEMWRSYYAKEHLKLFNQLISLLRTQYRMTATQSYVAAFHAAKSAFVFKDGQTRTDYERALPDLLDYYQAIRKVSKTPFDVQRAARLELAWWIVHRQRSRHAAGDLDSALAKLAGELYQLPAARFAEHARYRAEAMIIRDDSTERGQLTEAEWQHIHDLLQRSWLSLWQAVNAPYQTKT